MDTDTSTNNTVNNEPQRRRRRWHRRRQQRAIPHNELGFYMESNYNPPPGVQDDWGSEWNPGTSVEIIYTNPDENAYMQRQMHLTAKIKTINMNLMYGEMAKSELIDAIKGDRLFKEMCNNYRSMETRQKSCRMAKFTSLDSANEMKREVDREELAHFMEWQNRNAKIDVPNWMRSSVAIYLGEIDIWRFLDFMPEFMQNYRQYHLISHSDSASSILFVESDHLTARTTAEVTNDIRNNPLHRKRLGEKVNFSVPLAGYSVEMSYGEAPRCLKDERDSPFLVIMDLDRPNSCEDDAIEFFEGIFRERIDGARVLTPIEEQYVFEQRFFPDLIITQGQLRLLDFGTPEVKNRVIEHGFPNQFSPNFHSRPIFYMYYTDEMKSSRVFEKASLRITYDVSWKVERGVRVTLEYENEKEFASKSLLEHGLVAYFGNDYSHLDGGPMPERWNVNCKSFTILYFPRECNSFEARRWLVRRILNENSIEFESILPYEVKPTVQQKRDAQQAKRRDLLDLTEYEMIQAGFDSRAWMPINERDWNTAALHARQGVALYRRVIAQREDKPWVVVELPQKIQFFHPYKVIFKNTEIGIRILDSIVEKRKDGPTLICDWSDKIGPNLRPSLLKTIVISPELRFACEEPIKELDEQIRAQFSTEHLQNLEEEEENVKMTEDGAFFYHARIFEQPISQKMIRIGVEGWNAPNVREEFSKLQEILKPIEISYDENPELFCGVGEIYVRKLPLKFQYKVLVDIDKYLGKISILGAQKIEAREDLMSFSDRKSEILIQTEIPVGFPFYSEDVLRNLELNFPHLQKMLMAKIKMKWGESAWVTSLEFEGTIEAYELFQELLKKLNQLIFEKMTNVRKSDVPLVTACPACMCELEPTSDYYRMQCGHVLCRTCLNMMVRTNIDSGQFNIECIVQGCTELLSPEELKDIILGGPHRLREFDEAKLENLHNRLHDFVIQNSEGELKACPTPDCLGILKKERFDEDDNRPHSTSCEACHKKCCARCLLPEHPGQNCDQSARVQDPQQSIEHYMQNSRFGARPCPRCGQVLEKTDGCDHVECKCGCHICWRCNKTFQAGRDCYDHMREEHNGAHGPNGPWVFLENGDPIPPHVFDVPEWEDDDDDSDDDDDDIHEFMGFPPPPLVPIVPVEPVAPRAQNLQMRLNEFLPVIGAGPGRFPVFLNGRLFMMRDEPENGEDAPARIEFDDFPVQLLRRYPQLENDDNIKHAILAYLNDAATKNDMAERMFEIFQQPQMLDVFTD